MIRLIGIDPGLRFMGWGIIDVAGNRLKHVADGVLATKATDTVPQRLAMLHDGLRDLIQCYSPVEAAVEETYVNRNGSSTLKLGYARGVALLVPTLLDMTVHEYGALAVKRAVVGTGSATKEQVSMMVKRLLPGATLKRSDASDALAIAVCHAHHRASVAHISSGVRMA